VEKYELSSREKAILRYVIHQFILTASPVGSRNISKKYEVGLSPASIRNIMSDLEEFGFLNHPHTSAGRVPTDKGYRFYVDSIMEPPLLDWENQKYIQNELGGIPPETDDLLSVTSAILSDITNQLACVTYPKFEQAILQKIQLVQLSATRLMVIVSIKLGMIKTITLELESEIKREKVELTQQFLNERLSGLKFSDIRNTFSERIKDYTSEYKPIIRVFIDSVDKIFTDLKISQKSIITGTKNIFKHPEFEDHEQLQGIVELIEDKDVIIHIMDKKKSSNIGDISISIGKENEEKKFTNYSMVTKEYSVGGIKGTLGIMGPKRMEYSKVIATVMYVADLLTSTFKKQSI